MKIAIFGFGGHAKEVAVQVNEPIDFFVDDNLTNEFTKPISSFNPKTHLIMIAVAEPKERERIVDRLPKNTKYFTFIHPTSQIMSKDIIIGEGSFIGANTILTTNIKIGKHSILNRGNQIGHDCIIGDYFSAMPSAVVSGNVKIGNRVYLGTLSSIKQNITICDDVTIGLNSGVVKHITEKGIYAHTPSKKIN